MKDITLQRYQQTLEPVIFWWGSWDLLSSPLLFRCSNREKYGKLLPILLRRTLKTMSNSQTCDIHYFSACEEACSRDLHIYHRFNTFLFIFNGSHRTSCWTWKIFNYINFAALHYCGFSPQHCLLIRRLKALSQSSFFSNFFLTHCSRYARKVW